MPGTELVPYVSPEEQARRAEEEREKRYRSSKAELEDRIHKVLDLMLAGARSHEIVRLCSAEWKISGRQVENYIRRAHELRHELALEQAAKLVDDVLIEYWELYRACFASKDYSECRRLLKDMAVLRGQWVNRSGPEREDPFLAGIEELNASLAGMKGADYESPAYTPAEGEDS